MQRQQAIDRLEFENPHRSVNAVDRIFGAIVGSVGIRRESREKEMSNPKSRTQYRERLEHLSIMLAKEIAELAEFEAPGFCSSSEFRSALTGAVWASLDFQITEDGHRISPASVRVAALTNQAKTSQYGQN